ncbi:hypothetical protein ACFL04_03880 [Patescibacteria group bacterium]
MSLVFSALVPHPPLLIPSIGKNHFKRFNITANAYKEVIADLYSSKPDILVLISPHGYFSEHGIIASLAENYHPSVSEFGDFNFVRTFKPSFSLLNEINEQANNNDINCRIIQNDKLDYGFSVPLWHFTDEFLPVSLVPLNTFNGDAEFHYNFGKFLYHIICQLNKRVAVLSSGDLSHTLSELSSAGYHKDGHKLIKIINQSFDKNDLSDLFQINSRIIKNSKSCGYYPLLLLAGLLSSIKYNSTTLSYQEVLGVGYQVTKFESL